MSRRGVASANTGRSLVSTDNNGLLAPVVVLALLSAGLFLEGVVLSSELAGTGS